MEQHEHVKTTSEFLPQEQSVYPSVLVFVNLRAGEKHLHCLDASSSKILLQKHQVAKKTFKLPKLLSALGLILVLTEVSVQRAVPTLFLSAQSCSSCF